MEQKENETEQRVTAKTLNCVEVPGGHIYGVKIEPDKEVWELKEEIQKKNSPRIKCAASDLTLYIAKRNGVWLKWNDDAIQELKKDNDVPIKVIMTEEMPPVYPIDEPSFAFPDTPSKGDIHILVELPQDVLTQASTRKRRHQDYDSDEMNRRVTLAAVCDSTTWWITEFTKCQIPQERLPLVGELANFIQQALPIKIRVTDVVFNDWSTKVKPPNPELLNNLFQVSNSEPCTDLVADIVRFIVAPITRVAETEMSFVTFWDVLIRHTLDYIDIGQSNRDSNRLASTGSNCPDFLFYVDSVCVFRGEEKAPGAAVNTVRLELSKKLVWSYGKAPYLFGYTAVGFHTHLYAIVCTGDQVQTVELGKFYLLNVRDRLRLFLAILNMALLLPTIAKMCPDSARGEYSWMARDGGFKIHFEPFRVVKAYWDPTQYKEAKRHAGLVYTVLKDNVVPNVDFFDHTDDSGHRLVFTPRGDEKRPEDLVELFEALKNVLQALVKLHAAGWMHRDIRWSNVIKYRNQNSWFLIDFMDTAQSPQYTPSGGHLNQAEHAPEIFNASTHTTSVDLWSVGRLIQTCSDVRWYDLNGSRSQFLAWLMHENPTARPTAAEALNRLRQLEEEYMTQ